MFLWLWTNPPAAAGERWSDLADTVFQNYDRAAGLPLQVVSALAQDGDGFLWVGTQGGLARWDGYRFRNYLADAADEGALPDLYVRTLHVDPSGRLWIGTFNGGLARYDREQDRFVTWPAGPGGLSHVTVGAIEDDGAGGIWIGTPVGLDHLDPATGKIVSLRPDAHDPDSLPAGEIRALLRDPGGTLWVGTKLGLARKDGGRFVSVPLGASEDRGGIVMSLFEDSSAHLWVGTLRHGAFLLDPATGTQRKVELSAAPSKTETGTVTRIIGAGAGEVWLASYDGIVVTDEAGHFLRRISHNPMIPGSLAHDTVLTLFRDRAGSIWAGGLAGLGRCAAPGGAVLSLMGAPNRASGLTLTDVIAVRAAEDGRIWLGGRNEGIEIIDPTGGPPVRLEPDSGKPATSLPADGVRNMIGAGDAVYIATNGGLYRSDPDGRHVARVTIPGRAPDATTMYVQSADGVVWVGGSTDGLWNLSPDGAPGPFPHLAPDRLSDRVIIFVEPGRSGELWIGTYNGLNRFDPASGAVETILPDPANPTALPPGMSSTLLFDRAGRLWVGTMGGGIGILTGRDGQSRPRFRRLGTADGLPGPFIDQLLLDQAGRIWASTDNGLAVIDPETLHIRRLGRGDGVAVMSNWIHAGAATAKGELLFGGAGGLSVVEPDRIRDWDYRPPVVVTDLRVGGRPVPAGRFNGGGSAVPLTIEPGANSLSVEFAALDFTEPDRNFYAYRLDGFDPDWIPTDATRRLAAYNNLPPGRYTLQLSGSNRDGARSELALGLPIRVVPAWYQTIWFDALMAITSLGGVATLVQARTAWLRRQQRILQQQVALSTAELRAANERLFQLATTDALTGCANRRHFVERAGQAVALARRSGAPLSLLILDLDHFKQVNDAHGHQAGDQILCEIARTCADHIRATDLLARLGGEEFCVLMPDTPAEGALILAERLRQAIAATEISLEGHTLRQTASFGLASLAPGESFDALFARADAALYRAKQAGRNRVLTAD